MQFGVIGWERGLHADGAAESVLVRQKVKPQ
jgi:hypothetical protein